jgi:putative nucleotidyltransferase with HDIG domain
MKKLPLKIKTYLAVIYLITLICILYSAFNKFLPVISTKCIDIIFFTILVAITESFTVPFRNMSFSTSFAIHLASYIFFGPLITIIIITAGFSLRVLKLNYGYKHIFNTPFYGTVFNYCVLVLSLLLGNYAYICIGGTFLISQISNNIFQIFIFSIVVTLTNTFIISILYSLTSKKDILYSFIINIKLILLNILVMAPFGILLAYVFNSYNYFGVFLVLFPIVLARYTFSLHIQTKSQYVETVDALMLAMEARDKYTEGHSKRVAEISTSIAKQLKYNDWKIEHLKMAALLHDVGKIGVDDHVLNKPGKLTKEEFDTIKTHPQVGYNILKDIKNLESILPIVKSHHERYDGKGYPDGKKAEELSLDVFIIQLADSIDAMTTDRPYRKALKPDEVIEEVKKYSGSQFHPRVVEAYFKMLEKQKR